MWCGHPSHLNRRTLLKAAGYGGLAWLSPLAEALAWANERSPDRPPTSIIMLWLEGGPSQLETFDPHPNSEISAGTQAIASSVAGLQLAKGMEQTAEVMDEVLLLRSVVSREGDHERAIYNIKTGYRPDPTLIHPSIGAVVCHQLPEGGTEIPRHVSILPTGSPGRGGYLGDHFDAFLLGDPQGPLPDMKAGVKPERFDARLNDLAFLDRQFSQGRLTQLETERTLQQTTVRRAVKMMSSEQLDAFNLADVPQAEREPFGDTPFGRGCLVAARLIDVGVRCVEVTLSGWDSHVANHELHNQRKAEFDPAFAALIRYLRQRDQLKDTIVVAGGEFGRTPRVNPAGGRDHWPHGFSIALAGGGLPRGHVIGETDPAGSRIVYEQGIKVADVHASLLHRLGINAHQELITPIGRPLKLSEGQVVF